MKTALLIIDVQSYFLKNAASELPERIAAHIKKSSYDAVIFTVFQNADGSNFERSLHWGKCKDPADAELPDEFKKFITTENTFTKSSYSAFKAKGLEEYLQKNQIQKVELCGIDLDACVLATAYDAFDKGYQVGVLCDLSYSQAGLEEAAKSILERNIQTKN